MRQRHALQHACAIRSTSSVYLLLPMTLTETRRVLRLPHMEVRLKPETESRLNELASKSGRATGGLVEAAMAVYLSEVSELRGRLDSRTKIFAAAG